MAGHHNSQFAAVDRAPRRLDSGQAVAVPANGGHFAVLDHMHAHIGTGPRISPSDRIMAGSAGTRLPQRPQNRIARSIDIDDRTQFLDPLRSDEFGLHALMEIGVANPHIAVLFVMGLGQHHHPARAEHDVEIQILAQSLIETPRLFVDRRRIVVQIVGANDRRVAPGIAAAQPALLDNRHLADAVIAAKIVGRSKTVSAGPDNDHIIRAVRRRRRPSRRPAGMMAERFLEQGKCRVFSHRFPTRTAAQTIAGTPRPLSFPIPPNYCQ